MFTDTGSDWEFEGACIGIADLPFSTGVDSIQSQNALDDFMVS